MTDIRFDEEQRCCINLSFRNLPSSESRRRLEKEAHKYNHLSSPLYHTPSTQTSSQHVPHNNHPQTLPHHQTPPRHHPGRRNLPRLQIQPLPQPLPPLPGEPGMLPQNVRVLRRPPLLARPRAVPHQRLRKNTPQTPVSHADV